MPPKYNLRFTKRVSGLPTGSGTMTGLLKGSDSGTGLLKGSGLENGPLKGFSLDSSLLKGLGNVMSAKIMRQICTHMSVAWTAVDVDTVAMVVITAKCSY